MLSPPSVRHGQVLCLPSPHCSTDWLQEGAAHPQAYAAVSGEIQVSAPHSAQQTQGPRAPDSGSLASLPSSTEGATATPPRAAGNGLASPAAGASDSGFPSGPFPLSGCFALNSQSSAFPSPPFPPLPPIPEWSRRIRNVLGLQGSPPTATPTLKPWGLSRSLAQRPKPPPAAGGWERCPCSRVAGNIPPGSPPTRVGGPGPAPRQEADPGTVQLHIRQAKG